jgi:RNA polymerase sigma factor for flagellar operon FliA
MSAAAAVPVCPRPSRRTRRDSVVMENLPLVRAIAIRVHDSLPVRVELDDLIHAGIMGLIDAATRYDADRCVTFSSYAKHRIKGAILDSLRQLDWASRDLRRRQKQFEQVTRDLTAELHRHPTDEEVALRMGIDLPRWRDMARELHTVGLISASTRPHEADDTPPPDYPCAPDHHPDRLCAREEMRGKLDDAMKTLPERYRKVVVMYYTNDMTMKEIGGRLGINESRVSQIHKSALEKMAAALSSAGITSSQVF